MAEILIPSGDSLYRMFSDIMGEASSVRLKVFLVLRSIFEYMSIMEKIQALIQGWGKGIGEIGQPPLYRRMRVEADFPFLEEENAIFADKSHQVYPMLRALLEEDREE